MKYIILGSTLLAAIAISGCLSHGSAHRATVLMPVIIAEGQDSGVTSGRLEVILDSSLLMRVWSDHVDGISAAPAPPVVDFDKDMVIAAFLGTQGTGGYRIEITQAEERADNIVVNIQTTVPGSGCMVIQTLTQAYQFITLPRSSKPVTFITTTKQVDCQ